MIFDTPKNEYKIRKNEFHKPTNAYVSRKSNRYQVHKIDITINQEKAKSLFVLEFDSIIYL